MLALWGKYRGGIIVEDKLKKVCKPAPSFAGEIGCFDKYRASANRLNPARAALNRLNVCQLHRARRLKRGQEAGWVGSRRARYFASETALTSTARPKGLPCAAAGVPTWNWTTSPADIVVLKLKSDA